MFFFFALEIANPYVFSILGDCKFMFLVFGNLVKIQSELVLVGFSSFFRFLAFSFFNEAEKGVESLENFELIG